jgi:hypothetical protein
LHYWGAEQISARTGRNYKPSSSLIYFTVAVKLKHKQLFQLPANAKVGVFLHNSCCQTCVDAYITVADQNVFVQLM